MKIHQLILWTAAVGSLLGCSSNMNNENTYNNDNKRIESTSPVLDKRKSKSVIEDTTDNANTYINDNKRLMDNEYSFSKRVGEVKEEYTSDQSKYLDIIPVNLDGYENWTPNGDISQYSVEALAKDIEYKNAGKQISEVEAIKIDKNSKTLKYNYPESSVVMIEVENSEGDVYYGTGVLIGQDTILTCAHIFYGEDLVELDNKEKYAYLYKQNISNVVAYADMEKTNNGDYVGDYNKSYGSKIYISSKYMDKVKKSEESVISKTYNMSMKDPYYLRKMFEEDFAIIKLDSHLGEETGWIGILPFETTGNQKWGTVYGFPSIVPILPDLNVMVSYLKKDTTRTVEEGYDSTRGIVISLRSAIDALRENGSKLNKQYYSGLMKANGNIMYSSYSTLEYGPYYPKLLEYSMSTYSGDSGAPIVQSVYNSRLGKYFPYTSGIHCGYALEDWRADKDYGDLYLYVDDYTGKKIDFEQEYEEETPEIDAWRSRIGMHGYNYGRQIDKQLYNYLLANGFYPGYSFTPEDRK